MASVAAKNKNVFFVQEWRPVSR